MTFGSRTEAGKRLGEHLVRQGVRPDIVLGVPRGGVLVAVEVARSLHCPLDVIVVRKLGHPWHREFAVGALAEDGTQVLDEDVIAQTRVPMDALQEVIAEEARRLAASRRKFIQAERPSLKDQSVLIVDDGLATGATTEVAVVSARRLGAYQVTVAAPVASEAAFARLGGIAEAVHALVVDPDFGSVGRYYYSFPQTTDDEVQRALGHRD